MAVMSYWGKPEPPHRSRWGGLSDVHIVSFMLLPRSFLALPPLETDARSLAEGEDGGCGDLPSHPLFSDGGS